MSRLEAERREFFLLHGPIEPVARFHQKKKHLENDLMSCHSPLWGVVVPCVAAIGTLHCEPDNGGADPTITPTNDPFSDRSPSPNPVESPTPDNTPTTSPEDSLTPLPGGSPTPHITPTPPPSGSATPPPEASPTPPSLTTPTPGGSPTPHSTPTPPPAGSPTPPPEVSPTPDAEPATTPNPTPVAPLALHDVEITANPKNVLSCFVRWTTDELSTSIVEFGNDARFDFRIVDKTLVRTHRVIVLGMHAETEYHLEARSTVPGSQQEGSSEPLTFKTGVLPESVQEGTVTVYDAGAVEPGWTLTNVTNDVYDFPATAVMYDMEGKAVWYCIPRPGVSAAGGMDVSLTAENHVMIGPALDNNPAVEVDLTCDTVWDGPPQPSTEDGQWHHHFEKLANGNYLTLQKDYQEVNGDDVRGDIVVELSPTYDFVWSWNTWDYLVPGTGDWTHANSATMDFVNMWAYFNSRNLSTFFKMDRSGGPNDGKILWELGNGRDFAADPTAAYPWFYKAHDPEVQPNGNVLVYDNGTAARGSRALEYALNEVSMKATIVWEFPGDFALDSWYTDKWYTAAWGDADRLPNGNTLINAGTVSAGQQSRIFEVTPDGVVVWEFEFPNDETSTTGSYRAERITPPTVVAIQ